MIFGKFLASLFISAPRVITLTGSLLVIVGFFQLVDSLQVASSAMLRGLHDARVPAVMGFAAYWLVGLPVGAGLAFGFHLGAIGVWWGLAAGLFVASITLGPRLWRSSGNATHLRVTRIFLFIFAAILPALRSRSSRNFPAARWCRPSGRMATAFPCCFPDGKEQTIRLYGADCIEMHVNGDDSNARRLRDQRRYFGIDDILTAKSFGETAKSETQRMLAKPFTVYTTFADGRGDGRFERVYGFVETSEGKDLSAWLVSQGLARAFGVVRQLPDGTSGNEWREQLADLELIAARAGRGAWAKTDWEKLPKIRKEAREETAELESAKGTRKAVEGKPVDINHASRDELMTLPGIGEKTALGIIEARPYQSLEDLNRASGIGPSTFEKIKALSCRHPALNGGRHSVSKFSSRFRRKVRRIPFPFADSPCSVSTRNSPDFASTLRIRNTGSLRIRKKQCSGTSGCAAFHKYCVGGKSGTSAKRHQHLPQHPPAMLPHQPFGRPPRQQALDPRRRRILVILLHFLNQLPRVQGHQGVQFVTFDFATLETGENLAGCRDHLNGRSSEFTADRKITAIICRRIEAIKF